MLQSIQQCTGQAPTIDSSGPNVSNAEGENLMQDSALTLASLFFDLQTASAPPPGLPHPGGAVYHSALEGSQSFSCFLMSWCVVPHGLCIWSAVEIESPTCPEENPLTLLCTMQNTFLSRMHTDCGDVLCFLPLYSSFVSSSGLLCLERICWNLSHLSPPTPGWMLSPS